MKHIYLGILLSILLQMVSAINVYGQESDTPILYNTVYLPPIEGGWTQPGPGTYEVRDGDNFDFTLFVKEDYDGSNIDIKVNGNILYPLFDPTDRSIYYSTASVAYKYKIPMVKEALQISIKGLTLNDPTGIGSLNSNPILYSENSTLFIETSDRQQVSIYSLTGRLVSARVVEGQEAIPLSRGIYLVKIGEEGTYKAIVR